MAWSLVVWITNAHSNGKYLSTHTPLFVTIPRSTIATITECSDIITSVMRDNFGGNKFRENYNHCNT